MLGPPQEEDSLPSLEEVQETGSEDAETPRNCETLEDTLLSHGFTLENLERLTNLPHGSVEAAARKMREEHRRLSRASMEADTHVA